VRKPGDPTSRAWGNKVARTGISGILGSKNGQTEDHHRKARKKMSQPLQKRVGIVRRTLKEDGDIQRDRPRSVFANNKQERKSILSSKGKIGEGPPDHPRGLQDLPRSPSHANFHLKGETLDWGHRAGGEVESPGNKSKRSPKLTNREKHRKNRLNHSALWPKDKTREKRLQQLKHGAEKGAIFKSDGKIPSSKTGT